MRRPIGWKQKVWFWSGVLLLLLATLFWLIIIPAIVKDPHIGGIILLIFITAPAIAIGVYAVRRGTRGYVVKETDSEQVRIDEESDAILRQKERSTATHKARYFSKLSWLIVIAYPILAIVIAVIFSIFDISVWWLILLTLVTFFVTLLLLSLVSKYQSIYFKKSTSRDSLVDEKRTDKEDRSTT